MTRSFGLWLALLAGCGGGAAPAARVVEARRQDLVIDVEITGGLKSLDAETMYPPQSREVWEFKITRLAPEGSVVKAGQEVIAFDPSSLEKTLRDYQSEVASLTEELGKTVAESRLARLNDRLDVEKAAAELRKKALKADKPKDLTAELTLKATALDRELAEQEVRYREARDKTNRQRETAQTSRLGSRLERARSRVQQVREAIAAMSVKAKRGGTVVYLEGWRGEKKKVGDSVYRMEAAVEVASLDRMGAQGHVDEVDASKVRQGQRVGLRLEAHPDVEYAGIVKRIDTMVRTESPESHVKVAQIELALEKTDALIMRPGMRFRGRVEVDRVPTVLQVPILAVRSTARGPLVMRMDGARPAPVAVKLGRRSRDAVEVVEGLREGDRVALDGGSTRSSARGPTLGAMN